MIRFLLISLPFILSAAEPLIIGKIIDKNSVSFYLTSEFTKKYVKTPLSLTYPEEVNLESLPSSIVDIPIIANAIPVIWFSGNEYTIEEMDEEFYYALKKIKTFFERFFYNTSWEGELKPSRLVKNTYHKATSHPAALFTGGVDSTNTVFRHFDENPILISFNAPHKSVVEFSKTHSLELATIFMNYKDFLKLAHLNSVSPDISKWFWETTMGLSWVGAATPYLYAKGIPQLYIPSGYRWESFLFPDGQTLRQPSCPLIDENLTPAGLKVRHDVFTMTRTEKIQFISTYCKEKHIPKPQLVVCNLHLKADTSYSHCNTCMKCLFTMLDILAIGDHPQDYGFTLSEEEFTTQFQSYLTGKILRRSGTYVACNDTQQYLKQHPQNTPFFDWFLSLDLYSMMDKSLDRPPRPKPFSWDDYEDLKNPY